MKNDKIVKSLFRQFSDFLSNYELQFSFVFDVWIYRTIYINICAISEMDAVRNGLFVIFCNLSAFAKDSVYKIVMKVINLKCCIMAI